MRLILRRKGGLSLGGRHVEQKLYLDDTPLVGEIKSGQRKKNLEKKAKSVRREISLRLPKNALKSKGGGEKNIRLMGFPREGETART